jgi:hypothetical protein
MVGVLLAGEWGGAEQNVVRSTPSKNICRIQNLEREDDQKAHNSVLGFSLLFTLVSNKI